MSFDLEGTFDSVKDKAEGLFDTAHAETKEFHEKFISEKLPDCGKYGDAATFAAELIPGVGEYNAIREGDWKAFAIAAGVDIGAIAAGAFTFGAGYAVVKGGSAVAKAGVKAAVKEVAEVSTKKVTKEVIEKGTEKVTREVVETGTEKAIVKASGAGTEKLSREAIETGAERSGNEAVVDGTEKRAKEITETGTEKKILEVGEKIDKTRFPEYMDKVEKITKREIPQNQKELIEKALKENDFKKLSPGDTIASRGEFHSIKNKLIKEWEEHTGQKWPRYTEKVYNTKGEVIKEVGDPHDAHHVIEVTTSGPHEWWNIHPASIDEHKIINGLTRDFFR